MLQRFTFSNIETTLILLLISFPLFDFILRNWVKFGGGLWDKVVIFALILFAIIKKIDTNREETGLKQQFFAFILLCVVFLFYNMPNFSVSFEGFRSVLQFMVPFFIGYYIFQYRQQWLVSIRFLMFIGLIIALYGLAQPFLGVEMPVGWIDAGEAQRFRAFSIVQSPNVLGGYMALLVPIGIGLFFAETNKKWKLTWGSVTFILLICLIATLSRGAWLAFAAAIVILAILIDRRTLIAVLVAGILITAFVPGVTERITYLFSDTYMEKSATDGRIARWGGALDQVRSEPFLGRGLGHYGGAVAQRNFGITYVDNYYAKTLAEIGLVGLTLFLWLLLSIFYKGFLKIKATNDHQLRWLMRGILTGLIALFFHNGVENIFEVPFITIYFWFLAGSLLAAPFLLTEEVTKS